MQLCNLKEIDTQVLFYFVLGLNGHIPNEKVDGQGQLVAGPGGQGPPQRPPKSEHSKYTSGRQICPVINVKK